MPKLVVLITSHVEKALAMAEAWQAAGAPGVTLIDSHGLRRLQVPWNCPCLSRWQASCANSK
jgi:hypothetical protein